MNLISCLVGKLDTNLKVDTTFLRLQEGLEKLKIETPVGSIESDYGNPFLDVVIVFLTITALYIAKKLIDKYLKDKNVSI